ncbi:MAG: outer membrane lipoprotein-sorting protein [Candidatus Thiodiazotropha sp. (ex. Lucinisca nassula)]|nr:outer membrane lipoprotein-sorting protein [Candidatus Thiodiazotropha sp. (ex. Lucinisca nassula)]PUB83952.1 MAG: outer membrane lipoprotein-sorting protein [gamma proteobacterium symbiont of Ctena orbiculata]PUB90322.1 MAG: outer membrane lipoprotein-sorting protein [gamma proteobacterium symbiont of Ctena orbiculata]
MKSILLPLLLVLTPALTLAMTAEERGLEIATEIEDRDTGFHDFKATMTMLLRNKHGEESLRDMRNQTLEVENDGDKTLVVFDQPRDVKGTALLSFSHKVGDDDQWLYLPALKRVKRIASRNKSGPFMGSEFAYEDISSQEVEKYTYKYIEDSDHQGTPSFLLERYPVDPNSGYTRQQVWVDKARYIPLKIDYYDRKNSPLKTLVFRGYQQYLDKYWRADEMFMENHQTGKSTLLTWKEYNFRSGLSDGDFNKNSLKRAR